ncbi:MAG: chalcone isomerase family protein [Gemmataceae bacterium]|nr:chalcone isomerase family protein [Gemmataceae bacterium]MCI0743646.1 chalcone isomerase family protein [Gemmataceae bacterium]
MSKCAPALLFCLSLLSLEEFGAQATAQGGGLFPALIETKVGEESVKLTRTGTAVRKKGIFRVYSVASYLEDGVKVRKGAELADADSAKQLQLVFLRGVSGGEMAQTFHSIFRQNHPAPAFDDEVKQVLEMFRRTSVQSGDRVWLTHIPKVGFHCRRQGKEDLLIKNVDFSKAVWENYFGKRNVSEDVKRGLLSEL